MSRNAARTLWPRRSRARDNAGWMKMARALVDAAAMAAGDAITSTCESCHQPYRDGGRQMRGNAE